MKLTLSVLTAIILFAVKIAFAQEQAAIPGVIAAGTRVELVQEGFSWTEGPAGGADGGLYFNDVRTSRMYRLDPNGKISAIREDSGGANGMGLTKS